MKKEEKRWREKQNKEEGNRARLAGGLTREMEDGIVQLLSLNA